MKFGGGGGGGGGGCELSGANCPGGELSDIHSQHLIMEME